MLHHPGFDPVAIKLGPLAIHWYGLMYLLGFLGCWWLGTKRAAQAHWRWPRERVGDLVFYVVMGVILGGRIGYTLFYNLPGFVSNPLVLLRIWEGGMSFHGGLLGVIVSIGLFARRYHYNYFDVHDFIAPLVPFGLFTGRIGNFINGELWGAPTDLPWGMVFPRAGELPRHPSMLYEAGLEGLALLGILWYFGRKSRPRMAVSGLFLLLYGCFRVLIEFVRLPDVQLGYLLGTDWVTMGMVLSTPMILGGGFMLLLAYSGKTGRAPAPAR